jgi:predicted dehydrogenase
MEKIRMGLIGCGKMMRSHAQSVDKCTEQLSITAVCDVVRENAEAMAAGLNNPLVFTDYREMVDHVDAVLIALPHDLHYECGMFFARHKKHILIEKPLCNTEKECLRLIETCEEEGVTLMCAYPVRYWPGIMKMKEMIDSGDYGKVIMMSVWTEQLTRNPSETHWGRTARLGGGQLFSHGCHYIDLLLWFLGKPVYGTHVGTSVGTEWLLEEGTSAVTTCHLIPPAPICGSNNAVRRIRIFVLRSTVKIYIGRFAISCSCCGTDVTTVDLRSL